MARRGWAPELPNTAGPCQAGCHVLWQPGSRSCWAEPGRCPPGSEGAAGPQPVLSAHFLSSCLSSLPLFSLSFPSLIPLFLSLLPHSPPSTQPVLRQGSPLCDGHCGKLWDTAVTWMPLSPRNMRDDWGGTVNTTGASAWERDVCPLRITPRRTGGIRSSFT